MTLRELLNVLTEYEVLYVKKDGVPVFGGRVFACVLKSSNAKELDCEIDYVLCSRDYSLEYSHFVVELK